LERRAGDRADPGAGLRDDHDRARLPPAPAGSPAAAEDGGIVALTARLARGPALLRAGEPRDKPDVIAVIAGCVAAALLPAAILAPLTAPHRPDTIGAPAINQGPSAAPLLGTDSLGRDILTRLLYGARLSLLGPALVTLLSTTLGTAVAIAGSWLGRTADRIMAPLLHILFPFPPLPFPLPPPLPFRTR